MIIRDGFVTNSSSTNFMIISKEELSSDYLLEKLGFRKGSSISAAAFSLVDDIVSATKSGVRWFEVDQINYENILRQHRIIGQKEPSCQHVAFGRTVCA